jgi:hypothetical protein
MHTGGAAEQPIAPAARELVEIGEIYGIYRRDIGEIWRRYSGDLGEIAAAASALVEIGGGQSTPLVESSRAVAFAPRFHSP